MSIKPGIETGLDGITIDAPNASYPPLRCDSMMRYTVPKETVMYRGLKNDEPAFIIDDTYVSQIRERLHFTVNLHDVVIARAASDAVIAAEIELRDHVVGALLKDHPNYFEQDSNMIRSVTTGVVVDLDRADPMDACAVLASEDLVLMMPSEKDDKNLTVYRVGSGALIFPNGWGLQSHYSGDDEAEKDESKQAAQLGKSMREIHHPGVPHYSAYFIDKVEQGFNKLPPGVTLQRRNSAPMMTNRLMRHPDFLPPHKSFNFTSEAWEHSGTLRIEEQKLAKLPQSGAIVFSIKNYGWNMADVLSQPVARDALIEGFDNLSAEMFAYREHSLPSFGKMLERHRPVLV